ncbi:hypothetical protein CPLU01_16138, partial [Colletotrichum plurivorum]
MEVDVGHRPSFREAGVNVAASLSLNERQSLALQMVCRKLDEVREDEVNTEQLLLFIGGEGGTGKSRVIESLAAVFNELDQSHRLLVTATSGTAAASIDGITIHSACHLSQNKNRRQPTTLDSFGATAAQMSRMDGEVKAEWRNRWLLVIDEVSMLGGATLSTINSSIRRFRDSDDDFGGIPVVIFCGDFHQFRPVTERSIILPSDPLMTPESRHKHDEAHTLWLRFTTVIILVEQVRAAADIRLQQLLQRIRAGQQ